MNIILAILLFLLTALNLYAAWYIIRGRSRRGRTAGAAVERKEEKDGGDAPGKGTDKGSYCYPTINDMMGYGFVSVVSVPDDLLDAKGEAPSAPSDWSRSQGVGLTAVPAGQGPATQEADDPYPESEEDRRRTIWQGETPAKAENDGGGKDYETLAADINISDEELGYLSQMNHEWADREYDDTSVDDALFNNILDGNPSLIEQGEPTEEDLRASREREAVRLMREAESKLENVDDGMDEASRIMDDIEDGEAGGVPDTDDIPEI